VKVACKSPAGSGSERQIESQRDLEQICVAYNCIEQLHYSAAELMAIHDSLFDTLSFSAESANILTHHESANLKLEA
jgi:hypothetical protein